MDNEARLIRRLQRSGSRLDADTLTRRYYDEIYVYVWRQTSDRELALDLTQEVFMAALRALPLYDPKRAGFRTWLYRIATNKLVDAFRSRAARPDYVSELSEPPDVSESRDFFQEMASRAMLDQVRARVDEMDMDSQRIFRLKCFGEHTFAQIADMMSMPEATVKTRYYRLIKTLREEFGDEPHDA